MTTTARRRGFQLLSPERRREISSMGGQAAHDLGRAHEWKPGEQAARDAGRKGGTISRGGRGRRKPEGGTAGVGVMGLLIALAVIEMALLLVLSLDTLVHDPTWASVGQVGTLILIAIVVVIAWRRSGAIIEWSDRHGIRW
jgi:general stress protein YciG